MRSLTSAGPAALEVDARRARSAAWPIGTIRSFEPLPRARSTPLLEVDVLQLQPDRLGGAQPAGVHQLEQRAVAQRRRVAAARLRQQPLDLAAGQHLRQLAAAARRAEGGGRVGVAQALAAQVAVEGAQAGGLAVDRGRRRGPAARRRRSASAGQEVADVGGRRVERRRARAPRGSARTGAGRSGRPRACCARARARTRGRRGSRAPGARSGASTRAVLDRGHRRQGSAAAAAIPCRCKTRRQRAEGAKPEQADERLRVAALLDQRRRGRASGTSTISMRSFSSASALSSKRSVARNRWHSSSAKPGEV